MTHDLLRSIYGEESGRAAETQLRELMVRYAARLPRPASSRTALSLTERDALLITYADQVRTAGESPLRTLTDFARQHIQGVVSGIHLLPFYPWSSDDGFSVKDYFAIDPALGDWSDVRQLGANFALMFDAVFNHMSVQGDWFQKFLRNDPSFRDFFVTVDGNPDLSRVVRPRALPLLTEFQTAGGPRKVWTTFSADQVDLNVCNPHVLLALVEALLFYVEQGAKFIRLDAIAYLWKEIGTTCIHLPQTHEIIQLLRAVLDELAPQVMLITETNVPHADNLSYFGNGTNEAQLVYNFALPPLVLHSLATGNAAKLTRWAQSLQLPSDRVTFFNFLASHDGIGLNPARGILSGAEIDALVQRAQDHGGFVSYKHNSDGSKSPYELNINYFDALSNPAANEPLKTQIDRFICAQSIMLSLAGIPGIYFHSLFGSRGDRAGAEASGIPRRINRQKLDRVTVETELATPSLRQSVFGLYKMLLEKRCLCPAFNPAASQEVIASDDRVFAVLRTSSDGNSCALCLHNVSNESVSVRIQLPEHAARQFQERKMLTGGAVARMLPPYEVHWIFTCAREESGRVPGS